MPSEEQIFDVLARPLDAFRSALASTIESLRGALESDADENGSASAELGSDLGAFASHRIDASRFEALVARETVTVEPATKDRVREAFQVLSQLAARKNGLFRVSVEPGASLTLTVMAALAEIGRAYGAARVVDLSRTGRYHEETHGGWLQAYPFGRWNAAERSIAPPLVVHVNGDDLRADGLANVLDGSLKILLIVRGDAPPAPLARLVTPGVFVLQTRGEKDFGRFANWRGCGIAAFVGEDAATFVHDPDAGATVRERLTIDALPKEPPTRPLGPWSAWQLAECLTHLETLAASGDARLSGGDDGVPSDPVDKLAAWLLTQADLTGLE